jgi:hypothetical protein
MAQRGIYHELYDKQTQDDNKVAVENKWHTLVLHLVLDKERSHQ